MSDAAVTKRIAPVAKLAIDPSAKAPEPAKPTAPGAAPGAMAAVAIPPPAAKGGAAVDGKKVYEATCSACHASGVAGAPKLGDKAAWAAHVKEGKEHLYQTALKGKGAMPPKGGNTSLSDDGRQGRRRLHDRPREVGFPWPITRSATCKAASRRSSACSSASASTPRATGCGSSATSSIAAPSRSNACVS